MAVGVVSQPNKSPVPQSVTVAIHLNGPLLLPLTPTTELVESPVLTMIAGGWMLVVVVSLGVREGYSHTTASHCVCNVTNCLVSKCAVKIFILVTVFFSLFLSAFLIAISFHRETPLTTIHRLTRTTQWTLYFVTKHGLYCE